MSTSQIVLFGGTDHILNQFKRVAKTYTCLRWELKDQAIRLADLPEMLFGIVVFSKYKNKSAFRLLEEWRVKKPTTPIIGLFEDSSHETMIEAYATGIQDALIAPIRKRDFNAMMVRLRRMITNVPQIWDPA